MKFSKFSNEILIKSSVMSCERLQFCLRRSNASRMFRPPAKFVGNHAKDPPTVAETSSFLLSCPMSPDVRTSSGLSAIWRLPKSNAKSANRDRNHTSRTDSLFSSLLSTKVGSDNRTENIFHPSLEYILGIFKYEIRNFLYKK